MKILIIDNYDSFVYNIVGLLQKCRHEFTNLEWDVAKNDHIPLNHTSRYDAIILSPGPGIPSEAGQLIALIRQCKTTHPILGICLGCQAIAECFGCRLKQLERPRHGHQSTLKEIDPEDSIIGFYDNSSGIVGRYHSWVIDETSIEKNTPIIITSRDEDGNIMSIRHSTLPIYGVQFHPESIISENGEQVIKNLIRLTIHNQ